MSYVYDFVYRLFLLLVRIIDLKLRIKKIVNYLYLDKSLENFYNEMIDRYEGVKYELVFLWWLGVFVSFYYVIVKYNWLSIRFWFVSYEFEIN